MQRYSAKNNGKGSGGAGSKRQLSPKDASTQEFRKKLMQDLEAGDFANDVHSKKFVKDQVKEHMKKQPGNKISALDLSKDPCPKMSVSAQAYLTAAATPVIRSDSQDPHKPSPLAPPNPDDPTFASPHE